MRRGTNYEVDTLKAYQSEKKAAAYKRGQSTAWSWARVATRLEQRSVARELSRYVWSSDDRVLDIPCGAGILGRVLHAFPFRIVASDVSLEMMSLANGEYPQDRFAAHVRADITQTPFAPSSFACVVVLGFLHRVPADVKRATLGEVAALSSRLVILTCSVDTWTQRLKHTVLSWLRPRHLPAPHPMSLEALAAMCEEQGLRVVRTSMVIPFLSSEAVLVLEKNAGS